MEMLPFDEEAAALVIEWLIGLSLLSWALARLPPLVSRLMRRP